MIIEFLGTGGAVTIPRVGCQCRVCEEAREQGAPYSRSGPGLFLHGPDILIDTSEDIYMQLNRANIYNINACFYSHWHPDHTLGRRVFETLNADFIQWPPENKKSTKIFLPEQVAIDARSRLGLWDQLSFMATQGWIDVCELKDYEQVIESGVRITPLRLHEDYVYAFIIETEKARLFIAVDELNGWVPDEQLPSFDIVILPLGLFEFDPLRGTRLISEEHPVLKAEATFIETLDAIRKLKAKRFILTHIEEIEGYGFNDFKKLENKLKEEGLPIQFAYDGLKIEVK